MRNFKSISSTSFFHISKIARAPRRPAQGINGAGKTTTMNMLTGNFLATSGEAYLDGLDVKTEQSEVRSRLGYAIATRSRRHTTVHF